MSPWTVRPMLKFSLNSVPLTRPLRRTINGCDPDRGARIAEVLKDAAQDDRAGFVGRRVLAVDPDEASVLTVDDGAGSKVEYREPFAGVDRAGKAIEALRAKQKVVLGGLASMSACRSSRGATCTP